MFKCFSVLLRIGGKMGLSKILEYLDVDFWFGKDLECKAENKLNPSKITRLKRIPCMAIGYALCVFLRDKTDYETLEGGIMENAYSSLKNKGYSEEEINTAFDELGL